MFGMVLAIGILVDDAIVVVENVERIMTEEGLPPQEATRKAMGQITGAIIGITLVLISVFVPMAFFAGLGRHHLPPVLGRRWSPSIAVLGASGAVAHAGAVRHAAEAGRGRPPPRASKGVFGWFNRGSTRTATAMSAPSAGSLKRTGALMLIYAALLIGLRLGLRSRCPAASCR